ncbi:MAG TPA: 2,3,4,5-tetrahydropyridine-2,6-dicarboxylate N-succinyltransferase [Bacteroidota bacterium]|jgi:2,3,4,5-tetrahydropyridine-2-carboxylate N-succinyltransferase
MPLKETIERLFELPPEQIEKGERANVIQAVGELKEMLNLGKARAAEVSAGSWRVNTWVKKGILLAFRVGQIAEIPSESGFTFLDKETLGLKRFNGAGGVRIVPGGSSVRDGSFIGAGVVIMPPSYVNIGAYVDEQTMIDSHALVGSCAQVGKRVHLSAASQLGGVLEPVGSMPVVVEDDVFIGGNCGIYEGTIVGRGAVIAAGVILTGSTPVYDLINQTVLRKSASQPLIIPERAVVIAGNRHIHQPFAKEHHLSVYAPIILKYRDEKTDAATVLEESLR